MDRDIEPLFGFKAGEPVPEGDSEDVKAVWNLYREVAARNPGKQFAVGNELIERTCKPGADIAAVYYRTAMLQLLVDGFREQLAGWMKDGELDDALFQAAAMVPMKWMGIGVEHQGLPLDEDDFLRRVREATGTA